MKRGPCIFTCRALVEVQDMCFGVNFNVEYEVNGMYFENNEIGKVIKRLRRDQKVSQAILSRKAGISRSHLSMIEIGTIRANLETLCKLAAALDIKLSTLVIKIEKESERYSEIS